ncbi:M14 family metallopeptidase [Halobacteriovorax sp.]|uniref:M14 family metallopeptidase n=1 Tax=Halobacteriovorax sp. TaxID=2020862 RepID=UPI0035645BF2
MLKNLLAVGLLLALMQNSNAHSHKFQETKRSVYTSVKLNDYAKDMKKIQSLDLDVTGVDIGNSIVDLFLTKEQLNKLYELNFNIIQDKSNQAISALDEQYKSPSEIESILKEWEREHSDIAKVFVIGTSSEGRNIYALKISDNVSTREHSESAILFNSMHHAREVMSPEVSLDIIETLITNYKTDLKIKSYVDSNEIWVVPMLNVDGNAKVWNGSKMWRKNTNYGHGVDINRNYPHLWGSCGGSSGMKWSSTYRGPSAGSEPEVQALMNLVKDIRPVFDISYHAYSEIVIYPMGCKGSRTQTKEVVERIGQEIGQSVNYRAGTAWELLYSVDGSDIDWMYNAYQVIPYVLEVNSRAQGFQPDYDTWRDKTVKRNRAAWMTLLDKMTATGVKGRLDETYPSPENYQIEVKDSNGKVFQNYKINPDGTYHIVLNEGKYSLSLKKGRNSLNTKVVELSSSLMPLNF